jgi:hypothetical protein
MTLHAAAKAFYGCRFMEKLLETVGDDAVSRKVISETYLDRGLESIVENAGVQAGLELRKRILGGS